MRSRYDLIVLALAVSAAVALGSTALAANQRSFVAAGGDDLNPCTRPLPCRTLAVALGQTLADGEIVALDSAGYGSAPLALNQSISIIAPPGVYAVLRVTSGNAITLVQPNLRVVLRGWTIAGAGAGLGIHLPSAAAGSSLRVEGCEISGMSSAGLRVEAAADLFVVDSIVRDNGSGIGMLAGSATFSRVQIAANPNAGVDIEGGRATLRDSIVTGSVRGVFVNAEPASGSSAELMVEDSLITNNGGVGLEATKTGARLEVVRSTVNENIEGIDATNGGSVTASLNTVVRNRDFGFFQNAGSAFRSAGNNLLTDNNGGGAQTAGTIGSIAPF